MFGKFFFNASPTTWFLLGWLLLNAGGIVMNHEEDDEVIEIEPPASTASPMLIGDPR